MSPHDRPRSSSVLHTPTPPTLTLYRPDHDDGPSSSWSLAEYFHRWYTPVRVTTLRARPIGAKTLGKLGDAVRWWTALMGTAEHPAGPALHAITDQDLVVFADRLSAARFRRGPHAPERPLSEHTRYGHLRSIRILLASAGPAQPGRVRADLIDDPAAIYLAAPTAPHKPTWTLAEARRIWRAIELTPPRRPGSALRRWRLDHYLVLARATVGLWYYTGHRAGTYRTVRWSDLYCDVDHAGRTAQYLRVQQSIKTGRPDTIAVHPHLLELLEVCRGIDPEYILPWPISTTALVQQHRDWQRAAGLPDARVYSPQAWRRLHGKVIQITMQRHIAAARLAQSSLGHASLETTLDYYTEHSLSPRNTARVCMPRLDTDGGEYV